ncbi:MAG TPA: hypothetical protein VF119_06460 [Candidatus Limnocylindrales bacterium]
MITIVIVLAVIGVALAVGMSFAAGRVEVATSSTSLLGALLDTGSMPARPRGMQEVDLPRFVFKSEASPAL